MGLLEEALDEADAALGAAGIPDDLECRTRELKGQCLVELERHREAVHEFRAALDRPMEDADRRRGLQYALAVALESAEEWHEAAELYEQILSGVTEYRDATTRRERCLQIWVALEAGSPAEILAEAESAGEIEDQAA